MRRSARRPVTPAAAEPAPPGASAPPPRAWQGVLYRPGQAGGAEVRRLFDFAGAWAPPPGPAELVWIEGAGHNTTYEVGGRRYREKFWAFVAR